MMQRPQDRPAARDRAVKLMAVASTTMLAGCGNLFQTDCVSIGIDGVQLTVVASPNARPLFVTPRATLRDGAYQEQMQVRSDQSPYKLSGAIERPGTYSVVVEADGYLPEERENVRVVRSGHCNYLQAVQLTVLLVGAP